MAQVIVRIAAIIRVRSVPNASRTFVNRNSVINADALLNGDGGRVIADDTTGSLRTPAIVVGPTLVTVDFTEISGSRPLVFDGKVNEKFFRYKWHYFGPRQY